MLASTGRGCGPDRRQLRDLDCPRQAALLRRSAVRSARTFDTVVLPIETAAADFNDDLTRRTFLYNVSTDAKVRAASSSVRPTPGTSSAISARARMCTRR